MRQHLEAMGVEYMEAEDGSEALRVLRSGECFDLMLIDVNMPKMNGLDCVEAVRSEGLDPEMKVMMVTTEADSSFIERAFENGADEFLMKPFTAQSLREKMLLLGFAVAA